MMEGDNANKPNIGIIANPVADEGKNIYLTKFINILKPLSNAIFVIDGDFPEIPEKTIHIIKIKADEKKESMLIRVIKAIIVQLRFSSNLIKVSKKIDIAIFFCVTNIIPITFAKLMRKRTIVIAGGSAWKSADKVYRGRLFGLGGFVFPLILRTFEKLSFTFTDRIVVQSTSVIDFLGLGRFRQKIASGGEYIDTNIFQKKNELKVRKNLIGFISRLNEGKGVMNFIKSMPLVLKKSNNVEFLIGGHGPLHSKIRDMIKENKISQNAKLVGYIPRNELVNSLNELKLFVLPSYSEGLPIGVLEAMACGTPVLATPVGGIPDVIKDGKTGFILENNSPECIAKNVIRALEHPNLDEIVKNARKVIEKEYCYEAAVERYRKILENIQGGMTDDPHSLIISLNKMSKLR
jgi:glycosyltransferase involved in cell wall biosynthesis